MFEIRKAAGGAAGLELTDKELAAINQYTMREYGAAELFAFKVTMCDNEVDRDFEYFSTSALKKLAGLYKGRTVISDHAWRSENQCARIYAASAIQDETQKTSYGDAYCRLEACCYVPRTEETAPIIRMIEAGILKEVSVGCSMKKESCSICGQPYWECECEHHRGVKYENGQICTVCLEDPVNAYELSFVAVPAQPAAGVTKGAKERPFSGELEGLVGMMKEILKAVKKLESSEDPAKEPTEAEQTGHIDPEVDALIKNAKTLIKKMEGENTL